MFESIFLISGVILSSFIIYIVVRPSKKRGSIETIKNVRWWA